MTDASAPGSPAIVKVMSASLNEFHRSMAVLAPDRTASLRHTLPCPGGSVTIEYEALPSVTLGTLLALPRAKVILEFEPGVAPGTQRDFLHRFDLAFQRGGG
jgi:hypothetical protein